QLVRFRPARPRSEVVGVVVVDRVDLGELDEVLDLDRLRLLRRECLELAGLDHHVAVLRYLVALDDVLVWHLLAAGGVDALLRDAYAAVAVELVEADVLAIDRAVQLDGHGDQAEADRAGPDGAGHRHLSVTSYLHVQTALQRGARSARL